MDDTAIKMLRGIFIGAGVAFMAAVTIGLAFADPPNPDREPRTLSASAEPGRELVEVTFLAPPERPDRYLVKARSAPRGQNEEKAVSPDLAEVRPGGRVATVAISFHEEAQNVIVRACYDDDGRCYWAGTAVLIDRRLPAR